ncbi:hypothetical protein DM860_002458 [Cuscuta australis]|uniref:DNA-directed RNA polymerase subunit n=1 Tax=Cuscuta australis TaxID=267555 RepID=A0A328D0J8_9ASTE|nr:hypothetical protein DM860_002458 [Cuscuta australis]
MFYQSEVEHTLRLPPRLLGLELEEAIKEELEGLFVDKVIPELGLCISVYDIRSIHGGFILPRDGASTYTVKFRLIMFRPFVGEVIAARLKESTKIGLRLSLGFFDDIYVPAALLPSPSEFKPDPKSQNRGRWFWNDNEDFVYDDENAIRFQVNTVSYPPIPLNQDKASKPFAPMLITVHTLSLARDPLSPTPVQTPCLTC